MGGSVCQIHEAGLWMSRSVRYTRQGCGRDGLSDTRGRAVDQSVCQIHEAGAVDESVCQIHETGAVDESVCQIHEAGLWTRRSVRYTRQGCGRDGLSDTRGRAVDGLVCQIYEAGAVDGMVCQV